MAKKTKKSAPVKAFQFVFDGDGMKQLCASDPKKVLCTVSIETQITNNNKEVGALRIVATAIPKRKGVKSTITTLDGCPVPPCREY